MSDSEEDILITAGELFEMTMHYVKKPEKSLKDKCSDWMHWFEKRYEKIFKDAATRCEFSVELPVPFQPTDKLEKDRLRRFRKRLEARLPGCKVYFVEEEYEGKILYAIEISWASDEAISSVP